METFLRKTLETQYFRVVKSLLSPIVLITMLSIGCQPDPEVQVEPDAISAIQPQKSAIVVTYDNGEYCEGDD